MFKEDSWVWLAAALCVCMLGIGFLVFICHQEQVLSNQQRDALIRQCLVDHKEYECVAMFKGTAGVTARSVAAVAHP